MKVGVAVGRLSNIDYRLSFVFVSVSDLKRTIACIEYSYFICVTAISHFFNQELLNKAQH